MAIIEAPAFLPVDTFAQQVAANIRIEAAARGVNQSDIARALGVARAGVSVKWRGQRPWSLEDIEGVARFLRTTPSALCARRDSNPQPSDWESAALWPATTLAAAEAWELAA